MVSSELNISVSNLTSSFVKEIYPLIADKLQPLIQIFQFVGIALLIYFIFMIIRSILRMRMYSRIKRMEEKIDEILSLLKKKSSSTEKNKKNKK